MVCNIEALSLHAFLLKIRGQRHGSTHQRSRCEVGAAGYSSHSQYARTKISYYGINI